MASTPRRDFNISRIVATTTTTASLGIVMLRRRVLNIRSRCRCWLRTARGRVVASVMRVLRCRRIGKRLCRILRRIPDVRIQLRILKRRRISIRRHHVCLARRRPVMDRRMRSRIIRSTRRNRQRTTTLRNIRIPVRSIRRRESTRHRMTLSLRRRWHETRHLTFWHRRPIRRRCGRCRRRCRRVSGMTRLEIVQRIGVFEWV